MALSFERIATLAGLDAVEDEWQGLFELAGQPSTYLDFDWVAMCFRRVQSEGKKPLVAVIRDNGVLALAMPLQRISHLLLFRRYYGLSTLLPQITDMLVDPKGDVGALTTQLLGGLARDRLALGLAVDRAPDTSPLLTAMTENLTSDRVLIQAPMAEFPDGYDAYFGSFDGPSRSQSRRMHRHLERRGKVALRFSDAASFGSDFDWFLEKKRGWLPPEGPLRPWLLSAGSEQDLRGLSKKWLGDGRMWLGQLDVGNDRAAACLGFRAGREAITYSITYNPEFAGASPGRTLMLALFEHLIARGVTQIDFMGGDMEWKRRLMTKSRSVHRVRIRLR